MAEMQADNKLNLLTVDELLALQTEHRRVEIVDGKIVEMSPTGFEHNYNARNILRILDRYVEDNNLGYVAHDSLIYVLHIDPETKVRDSRIPDVSFFRKGKFSNFDFKKPIPGAPDLAVEVVSPSESDETTLSKLRSYFIYGTEQVWVVYPQAQTVYQYFAIDKVSIHTVDKTFTAETLFPGLTLTVANFFTVPDIG